MATTSRCPFYYLFLQLLDFLLKFLASTSTMQPRDEMVRTGQVSFEANPCDEQQVYRIRQSTMFFQAMSTGNVLEFFNVFHSVPKSVLFGSGRTSCTSCAILPFVSDFNMFQPHLYSQVSLEANSCMSDKLEHSVEIDILRDPERWRLPYIRHSTMFAKQYVCQALSAGNVLEFCDFLH